MEQSPKPTTEPVPLSEQVNQIVSRLNELSASVEAAAAGSARLDLLRLQQSLSAVAQHTRSLRARAANTEEEQRSLRALAGINQVINSSLELDTVLRIVMDTMIGITGAERGFLMMRGESGDLDIWIARNWEQEAVVPGDFAISRTVVNRVVADRKPVLTTNAQLDPRFGGQDSIIAHNLRSILCVPLAVKDELIGVLYADNRVRSGIFTQSAVDLAAAFSNQAAVAIDKARLFTSVRRTLAEVTDLKNLMDNVFASIASGVITADVEDKVLLCNRAAEQILGSAALERVGLPLERAFQPLAGHIGPLVDEVRRTDQPLTGVEISPTLPERGEVDLRFNLSPLKDAGQVTRGIAIVVDDLTEQRKLEAQRRMFERMVSPAVINHLDPNSLQLGGHRAEITVLFADIRGFTSFSESVDPETLVAILNSHLAAAAEAVLQNEGTIDKFLGDALMAWFNAPVAQPEHPLLAVRAALGIRAAVEALHRSLPARFHLSYGVGIHTGEAVLGLVGSERRLEYTAIGDCVNTAKRIQENCAAGQILVSEATAARLAGAARLAPAEAIHAKGKRNPVAVFEVVGIQEKE